jgi:hypothetical protein
MRSFDFIEMMLKAVKKTEHAPATEQEQQKRLKQRQWRAERKSTPVKAPVAKSEKQEKFSELEAMKSLLKAQAGEEAGAFRGGDPEELQRKKEEKREEREAEGTAEEEALTAEDIDPEEIAIAAEEDNQRKEDQGKSLIAKAAAILSAPVSPVDHYGDYSPHDHNGDPLELKYADRIGKQEPYIQPGPVRAGENQHKTWSEVLGIKIPLSGEPIQHLRRYWKQGKYGEMEKEREKLVRAMPFFVRYPETGILWKAVIYKGIGDAPRMHHKYVSRKWDTAVGGWEYTYADEMHPEKHGMGHTGNITGHTLDIHPSYKFDPKGGDAETAYHHTRQTEMREGGSHHIGDLYHENLKTKWGTYSNQVFPTTMVMPGERPDKKTGEIKLSSKPVEMHISIPGKGTHVARLAGGMEGFDKRVRRSTIHKERDVEGKPWMEWHETGAGKGKPQARYIHEDQGGSRHSPKNQKGEPIKRDWHQKTSGTKALEKYVEEQKDQQTKQLSEEERAGDSIPPEERQAAYDFPPDLHPETGEEKYPVTRQLERGELGTWTYKDRHWEDSLGRKHHKRSRTLQWDSPKQQAKIVRSVEQEHKEDFREMLQSVMKNKMKFYDHAAEMKIRAAEDADKTIGYRKSSSWCVPDGEEYVAGTCSFFDDSGHSSQV